MIKREAMMIVDREFIIELPGINKNNVHLFHDTYNYQSAVLQVMWYENITKSIKKFIKRHLA